MLEKSIENITTTGRNFAPTWINSYTVPDTKFSRHCLMNNASILKNVINLHIS